MTAHFHVQINLSPLRGENRKANKLCTSHCAPGTREGSGVGGIFFLRLAHRTTTPGGRNVILLSSWNNPQIRPGPARPASSSIPDCAAWRGSVWASRGLCSRHPQTGALARQKPVLTQCWRPGGWTPGAGRGCSPQPLWLPACPLRLQAPGPASVVTRPLPVCPRPALL